MCWRQAVADAASPALFLEDDIEVADQGPERLQSALAKLAAVDPRWDLLYVGRWALDHEDRTVADGIVRPGYSYCTFGYALSASGLGTRM